ncbi:MAG: EF-hand domain-containing protein [Maricaulaceae bacterium]|jgi:hypothetical protein
MTTKFRGVLAACSIAPFLLACGGSGEETAATSESGSAETPAAANPYEAEFNAMDANGDGEVSAAEYNAYRAD